ncbi:hypothetical protein ACMWDM_22910, partial [Klebsiella pneumoniae]
FMMNTYKDSIKVAKQMFPKVVRNTFFDVKLSIAILEKTSVLSLSKINDISGTFIFFMLFSFY